MDRDDSYYVANLPNWEYVSDDANFIGTISDGVNYHGVNGDLWVSCLKLIKSKLKGFVVN